MILRATDQFDRYLADQLSPTEKQVFEQRLRTEEAFAIAFDQHKQLIENLHAHAGRNALRNQLKEIHAKEFGDSKVIPLREETFARRHGKTMAVAASTAFIAVLGTVAILSTGGYLLKQQSNQITDLHREVRNLKASSEAIVQGIRKVNRKPVTYAPANLEGSAFALNNSGYIITSYHMVKAADSIFIQNASTERCLAKLILGDERLDLALLKVEKEEIFNKWQVPFVINKRSADVGEKVFTLGYPRKDMVYGEGALSSQSGYGNDTSMYQVSIPVNPGNSGGPLLDEQGNVIGVIRGKVTGAEGTGFAIKSNEIINFINAAETDSSRIEISAPGRKNILKSINRTEQVKKINPYVFNVLVY
jgi:serine protease Do